MSPLSLSSKNTFDGWEGGVVEEAGAMGVMEVVTLCVRSVASLFLLRCSLARQSSGSLTDDALASRT